MNARQRFLSLVLGLIISITAPLLSCESNKGGNDVDLLFDMGPESSPVAKKALAVNQDTSFDGKIDQIRLDPENQIQELYETNNSIRLPGSL